MSFVAEPPLTGPGAGGFMLVHTAAGESRLLDFFVAAPGLGLTEAEPAPLVPIDVTFAEGAVQRFNVGPASCGAYGTTAGMAEALRRFGTLDLAGLCEAPARAAREGIEVVPMQAFLFRVLEPIFRSSPEAAALLAPEGDLLQAGETMRFPELGDLLERLGREGPSFLYDGDVGRAVSEWVLERGGRLSAQDLAAYEVAEREPARVEYAGREVLTNPPPSSGGILIADALGILERLAESGDPASVAEVIATTNRARDEEFLEGLASDGYLERFLAADALDSVAGEVRSRLGSTTHIAVLDADGNCATVTCSNGSCSGVVVPGTGVHLNNMLGEDDLNPFGHHLHPAGSRVPSMMAPTVVLRGRRARGGARLGGLEPDPLGDPADDPRGGRRRPLGPGGGGPPAPARGGRRGGGRAGYRSGCAGSLGGARLQGPALEGDQPVLRRRAGGGPDRRRAERRRRPPPGRSGG